jgi:putative Mn2+ efflux pump MntP
MFPLAVATSIDALAIGVSFAFLQVNIWKAILFIGLTTGAFSAVGVWIGKWFGCRYKSKAEFVGGFILVAMGVKILIEHTCC